MISKYETDSELVQVSSGNMRRVRAERVCVVLGVEGLLGCHVPCCPLSWQGYRLFISDVQKLLYILAV